MRFQQLSIYIQIGLLSAAIDIGLMYVLIQFGVNHLLAAIGGFLLGLIFNFSLQSRITFKKKLSMKAFIRYVTVVLINLALALLVVEAFQQLFGMPVLGKVMSLSLIALSGYLFSKYWIYQSEGARKQ